MMFVMPAVGILMMILGLLFSAQSAGLAHMPNWGPVRSDGSVTHGLLLALAGLAIILVGARRRY